MEIKLIFYVKAVPQWAGCYKKLHEQTMEKKRNWTCTEELDLS
jgi:hypothetical protein